jgi:ADP-ribosyl-[dinitrogen reductase] hydrolase
MSGGYVVETYMAAMWAFQTTSSFEECIVAAVNRGHDSDTVGAVAGMIAGAYYGWTNIPARFTKLLQWHDELYTTAVMLHRMKGK